MIELAGEEEVRDEGEEGTHARSVFLRLVAPPARPSAAALLPTLWERLLRSLSVEVDGEGCGRPEVDEPAAALDEASL